MKTSLFPEEMPESLSPKVTWLRKHSLTTCFDQGMMNEGCTEPWSCYSIHFANPTGTHAEFLKHAGFGPDENAAILDFCAKHGLKHYSLE